MPTVHAPGAIRQMPAVHTPAARQSGETAMADRARDGHFYFNTTVNGVQVPMMFDTGASGVALRAEDAARIGIDIGRLSYTGTSGTANGVARFAPVMIESLTVGDITVHNVSGAVMKPGTLFASLLGQSFMVRLAGHNVEGNRLILRGK